MADGVRQALIEETQALLEKWKHPDPYRPPTAPGGTTELSLQLIPRHLAEIDVGSKYERNLPAPESDIGHRQANEFPVRY